MIDDPVIRLASGGDAAELARLVAPMGYPIATDDVAAVWGAWVAECAGRGWGVPWFRPRRSPWCEPGAVWSR